jgi:hypothetical protein
VPGVRALRWQEAPQRRDPQADHGGPPWAAPGATEVTPERILVIIILVFVALVLARYLGLIP